jgi:hypothetical protein
VHGLAGDDAGRKALFVLLSLMVCGLCLFEAGVVFAGDNRSSACTLSTTHTIVPPTHTAHHTPTSRTLYLLYSSNTHDMMRESVFMSGAGMSSDGPMISLMACTSLRVSFSNSRSDRRLGSTVTPPLAPPKGMSMTAVFHVMRLARLRVVWCRLCCV